MVRTKTDGRSLLVAKWPNQAQPLLFSQWIVRFDAHSGVDGRAQFLVATEVLPVNTRLAGSVIMPVFR